MLWEMNGRLYVDRVIFDECMAEVEGMVDLPALLDKMSSRCGWDSDPELELASLKDLLDVAEAMERETGCFLVYTSMQDLKDRSQHEDALKKLEDCGRWYTTPSQP